MNVVGTMFFEDKKLLIDKPRKRSTYQMIGGKVEEGETREQALKREIKEELELEINDLEFLTTVDYDYSNFHLTMHCFECSISGGHLHLNAHNDAKWVTYEELDNQKWVPADILVVDAIKNK